MTELQFPTTPGSSIRAVPRDYSLFPPRVMFLVQAADPELTVWIPEHSAVDRFAEHELTLVAVIHDEGRAKRLGALPGWDDLTDRDKGCVLLHASKIEDEGREYAAENYPAEFFDNPTLADLTPPNASQYVADMEWGSQGAGWSFYDVHAAVPSPSADDDGMSRILSHDEFRRLYDLALDAEHAS